MLHCGSDWLALEACLLSVIKKPQKLIGCVCIGPQMRWWGGGPVRKICSQPLEFWTSSFWHIVLLFYEFWNIDVRRSPDAIFAFLLSTHFNLSRFSPPPPSMSFSICFFVLSLLGVISLYDNGCSTWSRWVWKIGSKIFIFCLLSECNILIILHLTT
jgi:hypothetical protein